MFILRLNAIRKVFLLLTTCLLAAAACTSTPPQTPAVHTLEVTRLITHQVTVEVTRRVEIPVTVTPSPTWQFTPTPSATPGLPRAVILEYTDCLYGPADFYLYKTSYPAGSEVEVTGRSQDAQWISIQEVHGWNPCWIPAGRARLENARVTDLPFVYTSLPLVRYDYRAPSAKAVRNGEVVTVSWDAVWMSKYELRGYLIEAWVCRNGELIFLPIGISPTYEENTGRLSVEITDEAGCNAESSARIATASKRGYTPFQKIFWPQP